VDLRQGQHVGGNTGSEAGALQARRPATPLANSSAHTGTGPPPPVQGRQSLDVVPAGVEPLLGHATHWVAAVDLLAGQ